MTGPKQNPTKNGYLNIGIVTLQPRMDSHLVGVSALSGDAIEGSPLAAPSISADIIDSHYDQLFS